MKFVIEDKSYIVEEDLHTHTEYSRNHAHGNIEDNVLSARAKGIKILGISDHGPGHIFYGVKRNNLSKMREEINNLNEKYDDIRILFGIEANIINRDGTLDISSKEFDRFDYVIAGYHYGVVGKNIIGSLINHGRNIIDDKTKKDDLRLMKRNTRYVINALENNNIRILTHPGDKAPVDILEIAVVCDKTDTLVEINTWHSSLSAVDLQTMSLSNCKFILSSDAHSPDRIGDVEKGIRLAMNAGIDLKRIVNLKIK